MINGWLKIRYRGGSVSSSSELFGVLMKIKKTHSRMHNEEELIQRFTGSSSSSLCEVSIEAFLWPEEEKESWTIYKQIMLFRLNL